MTLILRLPVRVEWCLLILMVLVVAYKVVFGLDICFEVW